MRPMEMRAKRPSRRVVVRAVRRAKKMAVNENAVSMVSADAMGTPSEFSADALKRSTLSGEKM